jgi:hypothetical protein
MTLTGTQESAVSDDELLSESDLLHLRQMEALLRSQGYVRSKHGFWVVPGLETTPQAETVDDVDDEE